MSPAVHRRARRWFWVASSVLASCLCRQASHAQGLVISELLAANGSGLEDEDGDASDWIEVQNLGPATADLGGWHLTDDPADLTKWRFPPRLLAPGEALVVFASGKDRTDAGRPLHASFQLSREGEYLALVRPDGATVVDEYAPAFPAQREDVSYGMAQSSSRAALAGEGAAVRWLVPAGGVLGATWTAPGFDDSAWAHGALGIGYDADDPAGAPGEVINLALAGAATQSSTGYGGDSARAIDGNTDGIFAGGSVSHTADGDPAPYWEVDLGAASTLERIVLWNRTDCCASRLTRFRASVFVDAEEEIYSADFFLDGSGYPQPGVGFEIPLPAVTRGRFVRVELLGPSASGELWLSLAEVEVFGTAATPVNVARGKAAAQSSTGYAGFASRAVDGDTDGVFANNSVTHTAPADQNPYWRVDLGTTQALDRAVLWNRTDCCAQRLSNFRVSVLDEALAPVVESDQFTDRGSPASAAYEVLFPPGTSGRYVRVSKLGPDANGERVISLAEVQAFATPPGFRSLIRTDLEGSMRAVNATAYVRIAFEVADPAAFAVLRLRVRYDDGFAAFLNGVEAASRNAPAALAWSSRALADRPDGEAVREETIDISGLVTALRPGRNVLAVQALNFAPDDREFLLALAIEALSLDRGDRRHFPRPTPGALNETEGFLGLVADTKFSPDRGFFDAPVEVTITTETPGAAIRYTTDGSAPTPTTGAVYSGPIRVAATAAVRAGAYKDGHLATDADVHTYIFPAQVVRQSGEGFPPSWGGTPADYEMDPEVVNDARYRETIAGDISSRIPTLSIVMDVKDLFGPQGIYSNPEGRGDPWERPCSMELIYPEAGREGLQVNCGIRVFGYGWRSHSATMKHAFRLMFRRKYGPAKLRYRFFPDFPVERFDNIVLRSQGSRGWNDFRPSIEQTCYIRDAWARYTEQEMGKLGTASTYVHLYLNGLYWGLYNPVERPDAEFLAAHLGGSEGDYDALNARVGNIEVIDGSRAGWDALVALARSPSVTTLQGYEAIRESLEVPDLIDYTLIQFYTGNQDWVGSNGNNMRVGGRPGVAGYRAFSWDMEYSIWNAADNVLGVLTQYDTPAAVYARLRLNAEFRLHFADRIQKHLFHGGALTPERCAARWQDRAAEIDRAVVGESARWGDRRREPPYTRDAEWVRERDRLLGSYFPQRTDILLGQLEAAGLYPQVAAPEFGRRGGAYDPGLTLVLSAPAGTILYTLDGADPRLEGGAESPSARTYDAPIPLAGDVLVRARARAGAAWSALDEAAFFPSIPPALRITEIHYHPAPSSEPGGFEADELEFLELKNAGDAPLDLSTVRVSGGVEFDFAAEGQGELAPGALVLLVENAAAFRSRYGDLGAAVAGEYAGQLSNAGEVLRLEGVFGRTILEFAYSDAWIPATDGGGYSLVIADAGADPASWGEASSWRASAEPGGTPGRDEPPWPREGRQRPGDVNQDGRLDLSDPVALLGHLFLGSPARLPCGDGSSFSAGNRLLLDANGDARLDLTDAVSVLVYLFQGGRPHVLGRECVALPACPDACAP